MKLTGPAIEALKTASQRWPNQYELLAAQVLYMEKLGLIHQLLIPLSKLYRIEPNPPQVQEWIHKYAR